VVEDEERGAVDALHLVDEHHAPVLVRIVGEDDARGDAAARHLGVDEFQELGGLGARGGAHVKDVVVRLHVQEERRDHANSFLSGNVAGLCFRDQIFVEALQARSFLKILFAQIHEPGQLVRVPFHGLGRVQLFAIFLGLSHNRLQLGLTCFQLIANFVRECARRRDAERSWERSAACGQEINPLGLRNDVLHLII